MIQLEVSVRGEVVLFDIFDGLVDLLGELISVCVVVKLELQDLVVKLESLVPDPLAVPRVKDLVAKVAELLKRDAWQSLLSGNLSQLVEAPWLI